MNVSEKHFLYSLLDPLWAIVQDVNAGENVVKQKRTTYLPATSGMMVDGMNNSSQLGWKNYDAYLQRAVFPSHYSEAIETSLGMMHCKPAVIKLPEKLQALENKATIFGENLQFLLRRINMHQLVEGRVGLLLDLPEQPNQANPLPYIAVYNARHIVNWDNGAVDDAMLPKLNLVVLNETTKTRVGFTWKDVEQYRVLKLGDLEKNETQGVYGVGVFSSEKNTLQYSEVEIREPNIRGNTLNEIPFVFINSKDIIPTPENPPLMELANLCLAIYRGEADYRQNLFMQGQDTLVIIGGAEENIRIGAGSYLMLPPEADAKYVGVNSAGLSEQRQALQSDKELAAFLAGQMRSNHSTNSRESGDALRMRVASQTATLNQIALTGALGLESILKIAARWVGADENEVSVKPNLDFVNEQMPSRDLVELTSAKTMGAPISNKTIHDLMRQKALTSRSFEEEIEEINDEGGMIEKFVPSQGDDSVQGGVR